MNEIEIIFLNQKKRVSSKGNTIQEILSEAKFSPSAKDALAGRIDGNLVDLSYCSQGNAQRVEIITFDSPEGKEIYRHSTSHIMAQAVQELFPEVKLGIGPAIEEGFYYDFEKRESFVPDDLSKIEERMKEIIKRNLPFVRKEVTKEEARKLFQKKGQKFKLELVSELEGDKVTLYYQDDFVDLCRGPHIPSTGYLKAFKLLSVAGAYWRGDENRPMLQRIYGTAYEKQEDLEAHLRRLEEVKKRDHRKLGKELDLYSIHEEIGGGLVHWHPKGTIIRMVIEDFWKERHLENGYEIVYTPHIASEEVYRVSGHLENYADLMYSSMDIDGRPYRVKPMNCPGHIMIYKTRQHSYKEMPVRMAEMGTVYRYEKSGVLQGLMRVRGFTIDDAHIFCRPDQLEEEIIKTFHFTLDFLRSFGFSEFDIYLATRPEKFVGEPNNWNRAIEVLKLALMKANQEYQIDEGGGAFYGPKIDLHIKDALGRPWQCMTIQFDFNLPERFDLTYIAEDGKPYRPYMVHRALLGSLERFFGVLIEHYAGAFPLWLAPVQVVIMNLTEKQTEYAQKIGQHFKEKKIRVEADLRHEKLQAKIRDAELQKVPYMVIVGAKEEKAENISVRQRGKGDLGNFALKEFLERIRDEIEKKSVT
ncbi:MAG: threonine--tRNA ligase [Candidatus Edwardsbacteria bacterium]